ncbi:MAG: helix-turn-helix transcriptional regulator [Clostridiales bacterium]|nr:helix-turn-helix transcriptional regulator [Clostridiales bacterium]
MVKQEIALDSEHSLQTISPIKDVYFTASTMCPKNKKSGLFIIGPFSYNKSNSLGLIYKPEFVLPHILSTLKTIWNECPHTEPGFPRCHAYNLHVKRAIDYIYENYDRPISLSDMAKHLNINRHYFSSMFKRETGKTFIQFLNEVRIEKSKQMLRNQDLSMLDIALASGFNNQNYFNIMFKKITNTTPREYQNSAL